MKRIIDLTSPRRVKRAAYSVLVGGAFLSLALACGSSSPSGEDILECNATSSECGGACVDLNQNNANCGACGVSCGTASSCVGAGICQCQPDYSVCGDQCSNLRSVWFNLSSVWCNDRYVSVSSVTHHGEISFMFFQFVLIANNSVCVICVIWLL